MSAEYEMAEGQLHALGLIQETLECIALRMSALVRLYALQLKCGADKGTARIIEEIVAEL